MKVVLCGNCGCPLSMHERLTPFVCYLVESKWCEHECAGFVPVMSDVKAASVDTERGA